MSITGGISDGSLFGGTGNHSFNFSGRVAGVVDAGTGADSVVLYGNHADTVTLTGALTSTTLSAGNGNDSIVVQSNVSVGLISLDAGADTINFTASSVSILGTTIKGDSGATTSASMALMMLFSILPLEIPSSVEQVQIPSSSLAQLFVTPSRQEAAVTALSWPVLV